VEPILWLRPQKIFLYKRETEVGNAKSKKREKVINTFTQGHDINGGSRGEENCEGIERN
jgi:hypothetical protein